MTIDKLKQWSRGAAGAVLAVLSMLAAAGLAHAGDGAPPPQPPAFYWVDEMPAARTVSEPAPTLPDLAVHWIERLPRYPRYCVEYSLGLPRL